jgi:phosphoglycerate kinase
MNIKYLENIDVNEKLVFVRNDFNVPLNENREIVDDTRIRESLPLIEYLIEQGARIICASHLGRPRGEKKPEFSLKPVAERLSALLERPVIFNGETTGDQIEQAKADLKSREILLLENLRFNPGETENGMDYAGELAKGIDIYVNNAFGACHRNHASVVGITKIAPVSVAGMLLKKEMDYLSMAMEEAVDDFILILGGVKVSDKIPVINNLIDKVSTILIGGAMSYTFLKTKGIKVGKSLVEDDYIPMCSKILKKAEG